MDRVPSRLISAFAALPVSFLLIPYALWRKKTASWYGVFIRPLLIIFLAWGALFVLVQFQPIVLISFVLIIWQSYALKAAVDEKRPRPGPPRQDWQR